MNILFLAIIAIPTIFNTFSKSKPRFLLGPIVYVLPIVCLALSIYTFVLGQPISFTIVAMGTHELARLMDMSFVFDTFSGLLMTTVAVIYVVVSRYSVKLLQEDESQKVFLQSLGLIISFVLMMFLVNNLFYIYVLWKLISSLLNKLLGFYTQRKNAIRAANHALNMNRFSELVLVAAIAVIYFNGGGLQFDQIITWSEVFVLTTSSYLVTLVGMTIVLACLIKSVQLPFHHWLPQTMETPVPVSALMHAGILNAGGYLIIRLHELWFIVPSASTLLVIVGSVTACYGMLVMMTQTNVKQALAYSTIAQMGFMMVQCGLGLYSFAILHMLGHAFYKSYAFLSSGTATDFSRLKRYYSFVPTVPSLKAVFTFPIFWLLALAIPLHFSGYNFTANYGAKALMLILCLALSQISINSDNYKVTALVSLVFAGLYVSLGWIMGYLLASTNIGFSESYPVGLAESIFVALAFSSLYVITNTFRFWQDSSFGHKLYVTLYSGSIFAFFFSRKH